MTFGRPLGRLNRRRLAVAAGAAATALAGCAAPPKPVTPPPPPATELNVFGELGGAAAGKGVLVGDHVFQQQTFTDEGYDADVAVSPDGHWIVFDSTRDSEHAAIYLQRVGGSSVMRLTSDDSDNAFPCFSPDGRSIAFCSTRSGTWNLYVMDVDGRNVVQVTSGVSQCVHPSFSPDSAKLVYCSLNSRSNQWELWTVDINSGEHTQIGYGLFPVWCPSREGPDRIAFQKARERGSRWFSLWTMELVDGEPRHVTEVAVSSNAAVVAPAWSPDGKQLVFATILDPTHPEKRRRGQQDLWTIAADGSNRRRLTDGTGLNLSPAWGVDNQIYFVSDRGGNECVWSVRAAPAPPSFANARRSALPGPPAMQQPGADEGDSVGSADTDDADK